MSAGAAASAPAPASDSPGLLDRVRDREAVDPRHRLDWHAAVGAELHEERLNQVSRRELGLPDHPAKQPGPAEPSHAGGGKRHGVSLRACRWCAPNGPGPSRTPLETSLLAHRPG